MRASVCHPKNVAHTRQKQFCKPFGRMAVNSISTRPRQLSIWTSTIPLPTFAASDWRHVSPCMSRHPRLSPPTFANAGVSMIPVSSRTTALQALSCIRPRCAEANNGRAVRRRFWKTSAVIHAPTLLRTRPLSLALVKLEVRPPCLAKQCKLQFQLLAVLAGHCDGTCVCRQRNGYIADRNSAWIPVFHVQEQRRNNKKRHGVVFRIMKCSFIMQKILDSFSIMWLCFRQDFDNLKKQVE